MRIVLAHVLMAIFLVLLVTCQNLLFWAGGTIELSTITFFLDTVDPELHRIDNLKDVNTLREGSKLFLEQQFDIEKYDLLTIETASLLPSDGVVWLYCWWDRQGVARGVLDSYHRGRAPIYPAEQGHYRDFYTYFPVLSWASKVALMIQPSITGPPNQGQEYKSVTLWGHTVKRAVLQEPLPVEHVSTIAGERYEIHFPEHYSNNADVTARGIQFSVRDIKALYRVRPNHEVKRVRNSTVIEIGAMAPQSIALETWHGSFETLHFHNVDFLVIDFDSKRGIATFEVYDYNYIERSTMFSEEAPDEEGVRRHINLAVTNYLPASEITIDHRKGTKLAFPHWHPDGCMASIAITEHADYVGSFDNYVMYGNKEGTLVDGQGLVGNRIPLTKTIFAAGPDRLVQPMSMYGDGSKSPLISLQSLENSNFAEQIQTYVDSGVDFELGLHGAHTHQGPELRTTEKVHEALFYTEPFQAATWVDHGGNECLWQSGWDKRSEHYILDELEYYGFKYANPLLDKFGVHKSMIVDDHPSNLLFYIPRLDNDVHDDWRLYCFSSTPSNFGEYDFTAEHVQEIIEARGLLNLHVYLTCIALNWQESENGDWKVGLRREFNEKLQILSTARDRGDLFLATTENLNDHLLATRGVFVHPGTASIEAELINTDTIKSMGVGVVDVKGDSLGVIEVEGAEVHDRRSMGKVSYAWFNLGLVNDGKVHQ